MSEKEILKAARIAWWKRYPGIAWAAMNNQCPAAMASRDAFVKGYTEETRKHV